MFRTLLCLLAAPLLAHAQAQPLPAPLPVAPLPAGVAPPRIDGRLDDPAWATAPAFNAFRRFRPDTALDPAPYRSEARLLVVPGALLIGLRAWDPNPADLRAPLSRRDQVGLDQDSFTVWVDASGRGEVAQFLRVNAAGSLTDGLYAAAIDEEDKAPDFLDVEVAAQRLPDGYSLEIRWPLANLRFPVDGDRPWGLMLTRRVPRDVTQSHSSGALTRESPHLLVALQPLADDAPLRAQLADARHVQAKAELTVRSADGRVTSNLGAELQWRPRADWVLDALLLPDFSQVELDAPQLAGTTRFALFQTEKRAFFLESSDVVGQVPPDGWGVSRGLLAFYSRAVADPRWGLRATQRGEASEATALLLHDAGGGLLLRADAFGTQSHAVDQGSTLLFARQRWQLGPVALAPLVSLRDWGDGARGRVAGVDGLWQASDAWHWRGHWLWAEDRTRWDPVAERLVAADPTRSHAAWLQGRWRAGDWRVQADWERIGPGFANDNGFVPQAGIERRHLDLLRAFHPEAGPLVAWELMLRALDTRALRDPERGVDRAQAATQALQPGFWMLREGNTALWGRWNEERVRTRPGGVLHAPQSTTLGLERFPGQRLTRVLLEATVGERVDPDADRLGRGFQAHAELAARWPLGDGGRNLELVQAWSQGRVKSPSGGPALDERSSETKLIWHWSAEQALRLVWQHQAMRRQPEPALALFGTRERSRTGTLTWLARHGPLRGWSVGTAWTRDAASPVRREVFVKFHHGVSSH